MRQEFKDSQQGVFLRYKIWLATITGDGVLGEGRWKLLAGVDKHHSLRAAAEEMGVSYRKAWGDIRQAEEVLGYQIIRKERGGHGGGRSNLTSKGRKLLEAFQALQKELDRSVEDAFRRFNERVDGA